MDRNKGIEDLSSLRQSGLFDSLSEPISYKGMTLRPEWSLSEKIIVFMNKADVEKAIVDRRKNASGPLMHDGRRGGFMHDGSIGKYVSVYGPGGMASGAQKAEKDDGKITFSIFKPEDDVSGDGILNVKGEEVRLHKDGTISVGLPDGTIRRAKINQGVLDKLGFVA